MTDINDAEAYAFAKNYSGSGDWLDESGNSHDGTINGATHTAGLYFAFDGNDWIELADHANLDFGTSDDFTIGVAVYADDVTGNQGFISKRRSGDTQGWLNYTTGTSEVGRIWAATTSGATDFDETGTISDDTQFTNIGVRSVAGTNTLEAFLDGVSQGSPTTDDTVSLANGTPVDIGRHGTINYLTGRVFSYAIIRSALSDAEVVILNLQLRNQTTSPTGVDVLAGFWGRRAASWILAGASGLWLPDHASDILDMV